MCVQRTYISINTYKYLHIYRHLAACVVYYVLILICKHEITNYRARKEQQETTRCTQVTHMSFIRGLSSSFSLCAHFWCRKTQDTIPTYDQTVKKIHGLPENPSASGLHSRHLQVCNTHPRAWSLDFRMKEQQKLRPSQLGEQGNRHLRSMVVNSIGGIGKEPQNTCAPPSKT